MKIGFNARILSAPTLRGWSRYTINLLEHLADLEVDLVLYSDRPLHPDHLDRLPPERFRVAVAPPMRYLAFEQRWLPSRCAADRVDVLHAPFNFGLPWRSSCPRVLTLHDAILHRWKPDDAGRDLRSLPRALSVRLHHWIARRRAHAVIAVSEHARGDLVHTLGIPASRITVIPGAADPRFDVPVSGPARAGVRRRWHLENPYVLHVGGSEPRKNVPFLLHAFAAAEMGDVDLVLAGGADADRRSLESLAGELRIGGRLRFAGWVPEEHLPALYAEALCLVNPSEYEGFGLQLCEAMAVGCPVLAARATSLPEVLGRGGETFPLDSHVGLSGLLRRVAWEEGFRDALRDRGFRRSRIFSWNAAAEATLRVYESLAEMEDRWAA